MRPRAGEFDGRVHRGFSITTWVRDSTTRTKTTANVPSFPLVSVFRGFPSLSGNAQKGDPTGVDELAAARAARDTAVAREKEALADLRAAGIRARLAIDEMGGALADIARKNQLSTSTLSKLNPSEGDGEWGPRRLDSYQAIDKITGGQYGLAERWRVLDGARRQVKRAQAAVSLAEARTDRGYAAHTATTVDQDSTLVIDDVLVDRKSDQVVLDIRVRNAGERAADITRVAVRIVEREEFLTAYAPTAHYDLRVDGDYNEVDVAHLVKPDDVDRFTLALGFANQELGCVFTAELVLRFNRDHVAVSKPFTFSSCFE